MKVLLNLLWIVILFVAAYLVASVLWKILAVLNIVNLSVIVFENFLFAFFVMLFMFLLREKGFSTLGIIIVGTALLSFVLGLISPGAVVISI